MNNFNIAIIDSGTDTKFSRIRDFEIKNFLFDENQNIWKHEIEFIPTNGHGTAVTSIIINKTSTLNKIFSFKIFNDNLICEEERLISCLNYIEKNLEIKLINMSLGIHYFSQRLKDICDRLSSKGIILIAAHSNSGSISYPAGYDSVIGVDISPRCKRKDDFAIIENSPINVIAKGGLHRVAWLNNQYKIVQGVSFSCALVSNYVLKLIENDNSLYMKDVLNKLFDFSIYQKSFNKDNFFSSDYEFSLKSINNAVVFPYNKEITSLINFSDKLPFSVNEVYDYGKLGKIGLKIRGYHSKKEFIIKNIDEINYENFDTLILGHLDELEDLSNKKIKKEIITKCLEHNKNIYSFDDEYYEEFSEKFKANNKFFYAPQLRVVNETKNTLGRLHSIEIPVLGIFGTSKQQGKFTTQILIKNELNCQGYNIAHFGSEPQSLLFGAKRVFHFGYNHKITLNNKDTITYLNESMFEIAKGNPDLIVVGSQAGTIPASYENIEYFTFDRINYLLGTQPDCVVLCVNYHDSIDYIKRTIAGIESISDSKVIALSIFPNGFKDDWDFINNKKSKIEYMKLLDFKKTMEEETKINAFILGDILFAKNIVEEILNFF